MQYILFLLLALHSENMGVKSQSLDDIEKDLNRSLPEYPGFQVSDGIEKLRRVLCAYAWHDPELGYCQAMNIVASVLLMLIYYLLSFMTEEQTFWGICMLCDRLLPKYYSPTMIGAAIDQSVFETLLEKFIVRCSF